MPDFGIKLDLGDVDAGLVKLIGDDLPFTIARFLTLSAQDGQDAARALEKSVFKLRNDWTTQNTKITPATKKSLFSEVYTDTSNRKSGAPDYLPRQEDGGERVPLAGHRFLAIPTRYLRHYAPDGKPIPDNLRPSVLLPAGAEFGKTYAGSFTAGNRASGTKRVVTKGTMKKLGNGNYIAFIQATRSGTLCIFVRHGGVGLSGSSRDAEPWYTLVKEAHIAARFPMEQVVQGIVEANAERNFDRAAAEVLVNAALKSGLRVQF